MKMKVIIILLFAAITFSCAINDPYTGEKKASNTAKGAGIGAVVGAVVGAATASDKDRKKGALTGAAAGAAIGGGIGYYMDRQEAKLRERLEGTGVRVKREGDDIRLIMPSNITFAVGRYEIKTEFYEVLDSVAQVLEEFDKTNIKISGHTDSTGGSEFNQVLSEQRAESVENYLVSRKISSSRIKARGYGFRRPIASNDTAEGRQANRRVELALEPIE